jgi:hypothetical protein
MAPRFVLATTVSIAWAIASVAAMTYGTYFYWPDFVHVNYGFPLTFATHTLNTIAGPVDKWSLSLTPLIVDLVFWSLGMIVIFLVIGYLSSVRCRGTLPN